MNDKWENLGISNDFLFGKVMQNPELCKELLQRILPELEIDHIEYPELQKGIKPDVDAKSVRLDDVSRELRAFLDYVAGKMPDDFFVSREEDAVKEAKKNRETKPGGYFAAIAESPFSESGKYKGTGRGRKAAGGLGYILEAVRRN